MEGFFFKGNILFLADVKSPGSGELSLSVCSGGQGNRTSIEEKIANPRGCARGDDNSKNCPMHIRSNGGFYKLNAIYGRTINTAAITKKPV